MKELRGKLRQKTKGGNYYYRLTIANGLRKEFALKTSNEDEAVQKAADLDAVYEAPNQEVAFAQINAIKGFSRQAQMLPLSEGWNKYEKHPNRAMPHTVSEHLSYKKTYEDFVEFVSSPDRKVSITSIAEVESSTASEFADFMRQKAQAVDTHNRKIKRLRKIFSCLSDYYSGDNPFAAKSLLRSMREEQNTTVTMEFWLGQLKGHTSCLLPTESSQKEKNRTGLWNICSANQNRLKHLSKSAFLMHLTNRF